MNAITGFFMAWGMFLAVPCPCKRWDESARPYMLASLPLIGCMIGALWWAAGAWLRPLLPNAVAALLMAVLPWLVTGFIHLDGYMDVCDAVLSRRDLARRRQILKDPHCGAFGVVAMVLLALAQWSFFFGAGIESYLPLLALPVASRACAALAVRHLRPMEGSQYENMAVKGVCFTAFPAILLAVSVVAPLLFWHSAAPLAAAAVYALCLFYGYRQLDGMSGDVSGFALTLGELAGVAVLCLAG